MVACSLRRLLLTGGAALAAVLPQPTLASTTPALVEAGHPATSPLAGTVDQFYRGRDNRPVWFGPNGGERAVRQLLSVVRTAELDGLADASALAESAEQAVSLANSGNSADVERAERILSVAWLRYVQAIRLPAPGVIFGDPALVPRMPSASDELKKVAAARSVADYVRDTAAINPFYARLRSAAFRRGDLPPHIREKVVRSLDRLRMLPSQGRYLLVDTASQMLWMVENGSVTGSMKVIVGKPDHPTPMIASTIRTATLNPYWNVPPDLLRKNIAPRVLSEGLSYFRDRGYEALAGWDDHSPVIDPATVDWEAVADGRIDLRVRQRPGPGNMMGEMKFGFPNGKGIYLHDTPDKALFGENVRAFSSGCVRLEDAPRLAHWLLGRKPGAVSASPEQQVALSTPVPIFVTYLTAQADGGEFAFFDDIYGLDGRPEQRLASR